MVVPKPDFDRADHAVIEQLLEALEPSERAVNRQYFRRFGRLNIPLTREVRALLHRLRSAAVSVQPVRPVLALDQARVSTPARIITPHNAESADTSNVDEIQPGGVSAYDLSGLGVLLGQWDDGAVRQTHVDLSGRVRNRDNAGLLEHATMVAATMIGSGSGDADARGMADEARLWAYSWRSDVVEMLNNAAFVAASNHSYGIGLGWFENPKCPDRPMWLGGSDNFEDPLFGRYGVEASDVDAVIRETDHVSVWAAGNDRADVGVPEGTDHYHFPSCDEVFDDAHARESLIDYDTTGGAAMAKNALTIGAVQKALDDPIAAEDIVPVTYTSFGPADDGRIKPDLVAAGQNVTSASSAGDDAYDSYFGTSAAAATVTGAVALLVQKYRQESDGCDPRAAEMKALLVHTAAEAGSAAGPDYASGHGLLDARAAADVLDQNGSQPDSAKLIRVDVSDTSEARELTTAESIDASTPIRVTLAWTDPAAPPNFGGIDDATPALINDLDLALIAPDGVTAFYPWSLDPSAPTEPATRVGPNAVDNVEVVDVDSADNTWTGAWTIRVGLNGELSRDQPQPYALVSSVPLATPEHPILSVPRQVVIDTTVGGTPDEVPVPVLNAGSGTLTWTANETESWLLLSAVSGTAPEGFEVIPNMIGLTEPGELQGLITLSSDDPSGDRTIAVLLRLTCEPDCSGRSCGPDPTCSQLCGLCSADEYCSEDGQCLSWGDTCPHADLGSQLATAVVFGSTEPATDDDSSSCGGGGANERAFSWTAPEAGLYTFSTRASEFDTVLYLRDDACDGTELACNDDSSDSTSALGIELQEDQRVIAVIDGAEESEEGDFQLHIHKAQCPGADLGSTLGVSIAESSTSGGVDHLSGSCGGTGTEDVAFLWTAPADGTYWFTDTTSDPDSERVIYLLSESCLGDEIVCHDWIAQAELTAGQQVVVVIDGPDTGSNRGPDIGPDAGADAGPDAGSTSAGTGVGIRRLQITSPTFTCDGSCTATPGAGNGGGATNALCHCDTACVDFGDCCFDACGLCDTCDPEQPCIFGVCWPDPCGAITCPECFSCEDGVCVAEPDTTECDDDDPCTIDDVCTDETCAGTARECDDEDPCTSDSCDATTGECVFDAITDCPQDAATSPTDAAATADAAPDAATTAEPQPDAAPPDSGHAPDAGPPDAAAGDAAPSDAAADAAVTDAAPQPDAGDIQDAAPDTAIADAAPEDAEPTQEPSDAMPPSDDAGPDADASDASAADTAFNIRGGGCDCAITSPSPPIPLHALCLLLVSLVFAVRRSGRRRG